MDDLTREVLEDVARLKRQGVISSVRPCCGSEFCVCPDAPHVESLRDHARDVDEYDRALTRCQPTRLHVVTSGTDRVRLCDGSMTCRCEACIGDRESIAPKGAGPAAFQVRPARRAA